jgi:hypothetical protein
MEAVEFETTPEEGTIRIPEKYKNQFTARVRVVLMREEEQGDDHDILGHLMETSPGGKDVSLLSSKASRRRGQRMATVLNRLAESGGISEITDPSGWQREQRTERPLPSHGGNE